MKAVAAANRNTIVVLNSVGPLILEPWINHPNITAVRLLFNQLTFCLSVAQVVWAGVLGQEAGNSMWTYSMVTITRLEGSPISLARIPLTTRLKLLPRHLEI